MYISQMTMSQHISCNRRGNHSAGIVNPCACEFVMCYVGLEEVIKTHKHHTFMSLLFVPFASMAHNMGGLEGGPSWEALRPGSHSVDLPTSYIVLVTEICSQRLMLRPWMPTSMRCES